MKKHLWMGSVLADLITYCQENDLNGVAPVLVEASIALQGEIDCKVATNSQVSKLSSLTIVHSQEPNF